MSARFRVLTVGRSRCEWADLAVADYTQRIRRLGGVSEEEVRAETFRGDVDRVRSVEGERLLSAISPKERLIALDERGERLDTHAFAALIDQARQQGPVTFGIGGPYGHDPTVRTRAWRTIRLSDLVLNHQLARVILYEQLYRALTLLEGIPYHH